MPTRTPNTRHRPYTEAEYDEEVRSMRRGLVIIDQMEERGYIDRKAAGQRRKRVLRQARAWGIEPLLAHGSFL